MKAMVFVKAVVITGVFLLLVMIGLNNRASVDFRLPPVMADAVTQPAALMYFGFFAIGVLKGALLCIPTKSGGGKSGKPA